MPNRILKSVLFGSTSVLAAVAVNAIGIGAAWAQGATPAPAADAASQPQQVQEIVVTGSRVTTTAFNSPTPVNTVSVAQMQNLAITNLSDALNQMPSFRPDYTPATNFFSSRTEIAGRTLDLRGLGQQRTLVLVDGKRFVPSNDLDTLDLNEIPSSMISRAEVVTGGASAAYGADAVAGVVNLIMDTKLNGYKGEASYGISQRGDDKSYNVNFAFGSAFMAGRGHAEFGIEYVQEDGLGDCTTRAFCNKHTNYVPNPNYNANGTGGPAVIVSNNVNFVMNAGGVIPTGPLKGYQFDPSGNLVPFTFGSLYAGSSLMVGGDPSVNKYYEINGQPLVTPDKHVAAMGNFTFDVTPNIQSSLSLNYAETVGGPTAASMVFDQPRTIQADNAYLNASVKTALANAGVTSFPIDRIDPETGYQSVGISDARTYRAALGFKGDLMIGDWKWDLGYQYGETDTHLTDGLDRNSVKFAQAIDAVMVTPANVGTSGLTIGSIACRSTLTAPTNGCIPTNYFGAGVMNPASIAWFESSEWQNRKYTLQSVDGNVRGTLFKDWAGPVSAAAGFEYRVQTYGGGVDADTLSGVLAANSAVYLPDGSQNVTEGYVEVTAPLAADLPFIKSLDVDGAVRETSYSKAGSATTWKAGVVYHIDQDFMFRLTRSHDIRAPTPAELNPYATSVLLPLQDGATRTTPNVNAITTGNPNLKLEQAETLTVGGVATPHWTPGLRLSLDYYDISMNNAIDTLAAQGTINVCNAGNAAVCQFVVRTNGVITQVTSTYQNLTKLHASGYEAVANYALDLERFKLPGRLDFTINGNYVDDLSSIGATGVKTQNVNFTGNPGSVTSLPGVPRWRLDGYVTYTKGPGAFTVNGRFIPTGLLDPTKIGPEQAGYSPGLANSISTNKIDSRVYIDLSGSWKLGEVLGTQSELFGGITNVFDTQEPPQLRLYGNPLYFDPVGRAFKIGVRIRH